MSVLERIVVLLVLVSCTYSFDHGDRPVHPKLRINGVDGPKEEWEQSYWGELAQKELPKQLERVVQSRARNVIFFIGDGMGLPTIMAARTLMGQRLKKTGENERLSFEKFPITGLVKTYCVDSQVADSACSATAYLGGVKGNDGTIGVDAHVKFEDCEAMLQEKYHVNSIAYRAIQEGKSAGIVTTTRVTHASPAGAYAHTASRDWESDMNVNETLGEGSKCQDIAHQLIMNKPGKDFKVILGGGRREFLPKSMKGNRIDERNLIEEWQKQKTESKKKHKYVTDKKGLQDAVKDKSEYILGLFQESHNEYHMLADNKTQPSLEEMTEAAIKTLEKDENGYFLFVEGGRIDTAHHDAQVQLALDETIELSKAIEKAVSMTNKDETLIIVSADHSHVMSISGYPSRGNDILGASDGWLDLEGMKVITINYANGPGYRKSEIDKDGKVKRVDITKDPGFIDRDPKFRYLGMAPYEMETHGGEDVAIYAQGPGQHLFTGSMEQSLIPHLLEYIMCLGDGKNMCSGSILHTLSTNLMLIVPITLLLRLLQCH